MKTVLTQWIGGFKASPETNSKPVSLQASVNSDTPSAEKQSFMGLMMGFLGMTNQPETGGNNLTLSENAQTLPQHAETEGKPEVNRQVTGEPLLSPLTGKVKLAKSTPATGHNKTVETAPPVNSTAPSASSRGEKMHAPSATGNHAPNPVPAEGEAENVSVLKPAESTSPTASDVSVNKDTSETAGGQSPAKMVHTGAKKPLTEEPANEIRRGDIPSDKPRQPAGKTQPVPPETAARTSSTNQGAPLKPATLNPTETSAKIPAPGPSVESADTMKEIIHDQKTPNTSIRKEHHAAQKLVDEVQKKSENRLQSESGKRVSGEFISANRPEPKAGSGAPKTASDIPTLSPAQMTDPSTDSVEMETDPDIFKEQKNGSENAIKEISINDIKSAQLAETAGRKSFSRQIAQTIKPQFSQTQGSSQMEGQWKHHRFTLKDGSSIHISARSADGALQLQLNAGNGELSKIIQQHLPDIQQHVEQELNIKINLQLQDFSGGQPKQQLDKEANAKMAPGRGTGNSAGGATGSTTAEAPRNQVRYLGFNQNEWTA